MSRDSGQSCTSVAEDFGVGKTQIQSIVKRKAEVLEEFEGNCPLDRKRKIRKTGNEEINELCEKWFKEATSRMVTVTGPNI